MAVGALTFKRPLSNRLVFWQTAPGYLAFSQDAGPIGALHFELPVDAPRSLSIDYTLPAPATDFFIAVITGVVISYTLPPPVTDLAIAFDINTFRGLRQQTGSPWREGLLAHQAAALPGGESQRTLIKADAAWREGIRLRRQTALPSGDSQRMDQSNHLPWRDAVLRRQQTGSISAAPIRTDQTTCTPWREGNLIRQSTGYIDPEPIRTNQSSRLPWRDAERIVNRYCLPWRDAVLVARMRRLPWRDARRPFAGRGPSPPPPPPPKPRVVGKLEFRCLADPGLLAFGPRCFGVADYFVWPRRSYYVRNTASLIRLIDSTPIPCTAMEFSIDLESWTWQASATFPDIESTQLLNGNPTEVVAVINGFEWRAILDRPNTSRDFINQSGRASGTSLAGWLTEPHAPRKSHVELLTQSAQQLASQELPAGWALDWRIDDWTVPGGAFEYQNLTPIQVIQRIAAAAGAVVQADKSQQRLIIQRYWKTPPWEWPTTAVDGTLPSAYVDEESMQAVSGNSYNAVLVHGSEPNGVMVRCRINGTAGDRYAPDVADNLVTDPLTGRYRAIKSIADSRAGSRATLVMDELQAQPQGAGLILPGNIIDFDDEGVGYRAMVTGCRVHARVEGDGFLDAGQRLEVFIDG